MTSTGSSTLSGSLLIHKPVGLTSSDVVVKLKIALTFNGYAVKGFKIGHGGTLDPFATGVLVILIGEGTKLADTYLHSKKSYRGIIQLGIKTDSADRTGDFVEEKQVPMLSDTEWQLIADEFTDLPYPQTPPMHSAKKVDGKPLYRLAHLGKEVERKAILKKIFKFQAQIAFENPSCLEFEVECESGTYVRVLAEDLAAKAGTVAHLKSLVRSQSSDVGLEQCSSLESVLADLGKGITLSSLPAFRSLEQLGKHVPELQTSVATATDIRHGLLRAMQQLCIEGLKYYPSHRYVLVRTGEHPLALLEKGEDSAFFRVQRVFNP